MTSAIWCRMDDALILLSGHRVLPLHMHQDHTVLCTAYCRPVNSWFPRPSIAELFGT